MKQRSIEPICTECERLWRDYQRATNEHLRLIRELNQPRDRGRAEPLLQQLSAAEHTRKQTREAIDQHRQETGHC